MSYTIRDVAKDCVPPIVWHFAGRVKRALRDRLQHSCERDASWYDAQFDASQRWRTHYTETPYYFLWSVIVDRMLRAGISSILEVGCGAGQFACLLRDKGIQQYCGFDFSAHRVQFARQCCPEFRFEVADAFATDLFQTTEYDAVICGEVLEHVERDVDLLGKIRPGVRCFCTVPNFTDAAHVRYFKNAEQVQERYGVYFTDCCVESFPATSDGRTYFLLDGVKI